MGNCYGNRERVPKDGGDGPPELPRRSSFLVIQTARGDGSTRVIRDPGEDEKIENDSEGRNGAEKKLPIATGESVCLEGGAGAAPQGSSQPSKERGTSNDANEGSNTGLEKSGDITTKLGAWEAELDGFSSSEDDEKPEKQDAEEADGQDSSELEREPKPETALEPEPELNPKIESVPDPEPEPENEPEREIESESQPEAGAEHDEFEALQGQLDALVEDKPAEGQAVEPDSVLLGDQNSENGEELVGNQVSGDAAGGEENVAVESAVAGSIPSKSEEDVLVEAALEGDVEAQARLGDLYSGVEDLEPSSGAVRERSLVVQRNWGKAMHWWKKAASANNTSAMVQMGKTFKRGELPSVPQSLKDAFHNFMDAARLGDAEGQFEIASMYESGDSGNQDSREAFDWFLKAAKQGHVPSMRAIAVAYANGSGTPKNTTESIRWYREAAKKNDSKSLLELGKMLLHGVGFEQNEPAAYATLKAALRHAASEEMKETIRGIIEEAEAELSQNILQLSFAKFIDSLVEKSQPKVAKVDSRQEHTEENHGSGANEDEDDGDSSDVDLEHYDKLLLEHSKGNLYAESAEPAEAESNRFLVHFLFDTNLDSNVFDQLKQQWQDHIM